MPRTDVAAHWLALLFTFGLFRRNCFSARDDGSFRRVNVERVRWYSARTVVHAAGQITFELVSSRAPGAPSSRPYPEAFKPPKSARGSGRGEVLINNLSDSILPASPA